MCIIAAKSSGLNLPSYERLSSMWYCNPDGAGLMFKYDNTIYLSKGYMTFEDFYSALMRFDKRYNLKNCDLVLHFRYGTHGGIRPELCHPFRVSKSFKKQRELTYVGKDVCVVHNGVYPYETEDNVSDTMVYIKEVIYPLYKENKEFYLTDLDVLQGKLAFLSKDGISLVGSFIEDIDDGIYYSNNSYTYYDEEDYDEEDSYTYIEKNNISDLTSTLSLLYGDFSNYNGD